MPGRRAVSTGVAILIAHKFFDIRASLVEPEPTFGLRLPRARVIIMDHETAEPGRGGLRGELPARTEAVRRG